MRFLVSSVPPPFVITNTVFPCPLPANLLTFTPLCSILVEFAKPPRAMADDRFVSQSSPHSFSPVLTPSVPPASVDLPVVTETAEATATVVAATMRGPETLPLVPEAVTGSLSPASHREPAGRYVPPSAPH